MIERSALNVLLACALETSSLGPAGQAKNRLIAKALDGAAEPEGVAVIIPAAEVKLGVESRGVFQEARGLLIIADQARTGNVGVGNERENRLRQCSDAAGWDRVIRESGSASRRYRNGVSAGIESQGGVGGVSSLIGIVNGTTYVARGTTGRCDRLEISVAERIGRQR